jgi:uncharacterized protein YecT (DUF1311 family)
MNPLLNFSHKFKPTNSWNIFCFIATCSLVATSTNPLLAKAENLVNAQSTQQLLAQAPNCNNPQTQSEMNACEGLRWQKADRELNRVYQSVTPKLAGTRRQKLVNAQQTWLKFRDSECDFFSSYAEGGTMQPGLVSACRAEVTQQRITELNSYSRGTIPRSVGTNYRSSDTKLNQIYQQLKKRLSASRQKKLENAESAWIKFRDYGCEFEGISGGNASKNTCLIRTTEQRIKDLQEHLQNSDL